MANFLRAIKSGATALDLPFGGFTTTPNPQYESRKLDLCGYHHPNNFAILVSKMDIFFPIFATNANDQYPNIVIILQLVI